MYMLHGNKWGKIHIYVPVLNNQQKEKKVGIIFLCFMSYAGVWSVRCWGFELVGGLDFWKRTFS